MEKLQTCGFGSKKESACGFGRITKSVKYNKVNSLENQGYKCKPSTKNKYTCSKFGDNIGPTNSNFDSFYQSGTANSLNLNPSSCLNYNQPSLQRFGKKKFKIKSFEKKGTKGLFTRWCKSHGYPKVTMACINRGKKSPSLKIRRKAIFDKNIRRSGFGNLISDINYLKRL